MTKLKILALVVGMVMLLAIPATVSAQRLPPHVFVGSMINGAMPADGTMVTAMVNDVEVASAMVVDGSFVLIVDQGDLSFAGMMVHFAVDGVDAIEATAWQQGEGTELALTTGATPATPEPTIVPGSGAGAAMGPAGPAGAQGPQGRRGAPGADGSDGSDGSTGARGAAGSAGNDGAAGPRGTEGAAGSAGAAGPAGAAGAAGAEGDDGSNTLGIVALILAIVAIVGAGGAFILGRRA